MRTLYFAAVVTSFFFLAYSQQSQSGCLPYFHTWCGFSANLECRSEICCTWLTRNIGRKNYAKNCHLRIIAPLCRAMSSQVRHVSTVGKNHVKQQYLLQMSPPHYGKLRPTNGWDWFRSLGHPSKFQQLLHLGFITAATSLTGGQPNFAQSLAIS